MLTACLLISALAALLPTLTHASAVVSSQQIQAIAPKSSSCPTTGQYADECQTATQAVGPINQSFATYGINSNGEAAALIATMAFESGDFEYCIHHFPSPNPGQGTRNMQSYAYNLKYAQSISALSEVLPQAQAAGPNQLLQLLIENSYYDFGSAAWFLTTQCDQTIRQGLQAGGLSGFTAYVGCIGTTMTDDRTAYYTRAAQALGVKISK